jgi:pimeloyl-ACP methyl ester carboxylesterase
MKKPTIHFAHANGVPSACYRKMLNQLSNDYTIKLLPLLGMDERFPVKNNWHELADQIADSVQTQCSEPVIGMGHSMGALCTFFAAHNHPELFKAVVLMDPPIINGVSVIPFAFMKMIGQADKITPAGKSRYRRETWASRDEARENLGSKKFFQVFDAECFEDYIQYGLTDSETGVRLTIPVKTEVEIFRTTPTDVWRYRSPLHVPGLFIAGAQSEFVKVGFGAKLARQHGMDYRLAEGSHMFPLEKPQATADIIKAGLKDILAP